MTKPPTFADLFEAESVPRGRARRFQVGEEVQGVVVHITRDEVFVELDEKQQGWFDKPDLTKADGTLRVAMGERITGRVIQVEGASGQVKLGLHLGASEASDELLVSALEQGLPVEGKITGVNKGGAEVDVGAKRGFCPFSQLDVHYVEDPSSFVGRTLQFLVTEIKDRDVVLSRRKLLERQASAAREEVLAQLEEGAVLQGRVSQVRDFGAFVDLGGIEGLIPMRELGHDRAQRVEDLINLNDVVNVKVLRIERDGDRPKLTLSLKALAADPWDGIRTTAPQGRVLAGQVTRVMEYGAFVRLAEGIEGLLHVSELGHATVEIGDQLLVVVRDVDRSRRRVSLALAADGAQPGEQAVNLAPVLGAVVNAVVDKHERFGVFVQVVGTKGRSGHGLVPNAELGLARGADIRRELPLGTEVRAKVIDATEGRLRLSIRSAREDAERAVYDSYRQDQAQKGGMGTLGDLLKAKLEK